MVWGQMIHDIMQECLITGSWDHDFISTQIKNTVKRRYLDVLRLNEDMDDCERKLRSRLSTLSDFEQEFMGDIPRVSRTNVETSVQLTLIRGAGS